MRRKTLSNYKKRIINEEVSRILILSEAKRRLNGHDYKLVSKNYNSLVKNYALSSTILQEGVGDFFKQVWGDVKGAIKPEDEDMANELEGKIRDLLVRSQELRKNYEGQMKAYKEIEAEGGGPTSQKVQIELAKMRDEAAALGANAIRLTQEINAIRKKYRLQPVKFELDDQTSELVGVLAPDDGKYNASDAKPAGNPKNVQASGGGGAAGGGGVPPQVRGMADEFENPKAPGIFSSILDSYKYAFGANANMWKGIYNWFGKTEKAPPARQDDMLIQLLLQILAKMDQKGGAAAKKADEIEKEIEDIKDQPDEEEGEGLDKETPMSVMKKQKDVVAGADGQKEMPIVMHLQKAFGISQSSAQQIAKRIGQYLKERDIPIAESNRYASRVFYNLFSNQKPSTLKLMFEEIEPDDIEKLKKLAKEKDAKGYKKAWRSGIHKYHPDKGGEKGDMQDWNKMKDMKDEGWKGLSGGGGNKIEKQVDQFVNQKPRKAGISLKKIAKQMNIEVPKDIDNKIEKQLLDLPKQERSKVKQSYALALSASGKAKGKDSKKETETKIAGLLNVGLDDVKKMKTPEKIVMSSYKKERARIRAMGSGKGVIHKVISRFIGDNNHLLRKDAKLKDIFNDPASFNKFAKSTRDVIKRMMKRRGYEDAEIKNLLENWTNTKLKKAMIFEYKRIMKSKKRR